MMKSTYFIVFIVIAAAFFMYIGLIPSPKKDIDTYKIINAQAYADSIRGLQAEKLTFLKQDKNSPLDSLGKSNFETLSFFPVHPDYRFVFEVEKLGKNEMQYLQTSQKLERRYFPYALLKGEVNSEPFSLVLFRNPEDASDYFLPFADASSGIESYEAGRYINPVMDPSGKFVLVDFNLAYLPYCVYNESFDCPLPPKENRLKIKIPAGEQRVQWKEEYNN